MIFTQFPLCHSMIQFSNILYQQFEKATFFRQNVFITLLSYVTTLVLFSQHSNDALNDKRLEWWRALVERFF